MGIINEDYLKLYQCATWTEGDTHGGTAATVDVSYLGGR
jgi:hypothetical protein